MLIRNNGQGSGLFTKRWTGQLYCYETIDKVVYCYETKDQVACCYETMDKVVGCIRNGGQGIVLLRNYGRGSALFTKRRTRLCIVYETIDKVMCCLRNDGLGGVLLRKRGDRPDSVLLTNRGSRQFALLDIGAQSAVKAIIRANYQSSDHGYKSDSWYSYMIQIILCLERIRQE